MTMKMNVNVSNPLEMVALRNRPVRPSGTDARIYCPAAPWPAELEGKVGGLGGHGPRHCGGLERTAMASALVMSRQAAVAAVGPAHMRAHAAPRAAGLETDPPAP